MPHTPPTGVCEGRYRRPIAGEWSAMLVDEQFRKSVAFLYADVPDPETGIVERTPIGTAFFFGVRDDLRPDIQIPYLVTNAHVVNSSRPYGPLYMRMNLLPGFPTTYIDKPISSDAWWQHDSTDVALARITSLHGMWDHVFILDDMLATAEKVQQKGIGVGDDVFFAGLFSRHPGQERTQPIIRFGLISMMPHERIAVELAPKTTPVMVEAYLIEARSWGGHSGSPAYIHFPPTRDGINIQLASRADSHPLLLGIVSGHFDIQRPVTLADTVARAGSAAMNAGIAIVIPAQAIRDLADREDVVEDRQDVVQEVLRQRERKSL
ncbi:MAG: hypothetical protein WKF73_17655 [Nocardioidaceae bacterium]